MIPWSRLPRARSLRGSIRSFTLTDLGGGQTLLGQFEDLLFDIIGGEFQPLEVKRRRSEPRTQGGMSSTPEGLLTVGTLRLYGRADWDRPFLQQTVIHTVSHRYNNTNQTSASAAFVVLLRPNIQNIKQREHLPEDPDTPSRRQLMLMLTLAADRGTFDGR